MTLFLCGDVMTGRGIDQVLPQPSEPTLHEDYVQDARLYVELAEARSGPIPRPIAYAYLWGDALEELERAAPDARIINLETSITVSGAHWEGKGINYRMHPDNVPCLTAARIDVCALANNHVMDYGHAGLVETLAVLRQAGVRSAGAGRDLAEARAPAVVDLGERGRVVVLSFATGSSGVPADWAALPGRPGVDLLPDLSEATAREIGGRARAAARPGDVVVASIHWGGNWGYEVPRQHVRFAHRLIEGGVDIVHGHSSHHPRPIEVYRERLILYGCGDFFNDYEGISGHEEFRGDLALMYLATVDPATGALAALRMKPLQIRRFRLRRASPSDCRWLAGAIDAASRAFGARVELTADGGLALGAG